ncbi:MAG: M20 family peptidase [Candidatus Hydrogenedentes bacterium]|nr:M20 family peptidase [Candidatus Hydrogenedentota bacterium]
MLRRLLLALFLLIVIVVMVVLVRGFIAPSRQLAVEPAAPLKLDDNAVTERLAKAIPFQTISYQDPGKLDGPVFEAFRAYLEQAFPQVHATLQRELINGHSLLYTWQGSDAALKPAVFLAHYDVVPIDEGSEGDWTHPPFGGVVADGYIWGRGAIDDKSTVVGLLEAAEALLAEGFRPKRTIMLAFGHDEEVGGPHGAANIAAALKERGIEAWFTLDEGSGIVDGIVPGIKGPIALISLGEKGYVTLELTVESSGGHSSQPPAQTTLGILAKAIVALEENQMPARLEGPLLNMLEHAGPEMDLPFRLIMTNLWLFKPLLKMVLESQPATNAAIRTTTAPTILRAGTKDNVLPARATAAVNFRILPGDTVEDVVAHAKQVIDDERVAVAIMDAHEAINPSPVAEQDTDAYRAIERAVREVMTEVPVAPGMTLAGTDTKHFYEVAENNYRLQPLVFTNEDLSGIHGTNERVNVDNYLRAIRIWAQIMRNSGG